MRTETFGISAKMRKFMKDCFHDREIIFRSKTRHYSKYIYVEAWKQKVIAVFVLLSISLLSILYAVSFVRLYTAEYSLDTMHETSVVFRDVYKEVNQLYQDVESVRGHSYNSPETLRVLNDWFNNNRLSHLLERVDGEISTSDKIQKGDGVLLLSRQEMTEYIKTLENMRDGLRRDNLTTESALNNIETSHNELRTAYLSVVEENDSLRGDLNDIREKLYVRTKLDQNAEHVLSDFVAQLRNLVGQTVDEVVEGSSENLLAEAESLVRTLTYVQSNQKKVLEREIKRTDYSLDTIGKIIDVSGLTVNRLTKIGLLPVANNAVGGPALNVDDNDARLTDILNLRQEQLDYRVNKLEAMQSFMSCMPLIEPVDTHRLSSKFGFRVNPFTGRGREMHYGLDFVAWYNTPVWATSSGTVVFAGKLGAYGNMVEIDHGCGFRTRYGHMRAINVKKGDEVNLKQIIGTVGSTGRSSGPHVHYEIRFQGQPFDPKLFIQAGKYAYKGIIEDNG
ncbi:MAG: M23 family metallopeptidase [Alphaproteobacteria bacterium]|nr:M23 family metallopeptidase [Alphaproteobacteria bacterium]